MAKDMIWRAAEQWGYHCRKFEREASGVQGTMQTIREYGVMISTNEQSVPYTEWPEFVQAFHSEWARLPDTDAELILCKFKRNYSRSQMIDRFGIQKSALNNRIRKIFERMLMHPMSTLSSLSTTEPDTLYKVQV
ncbi:MAG: hypothetical protein AAF578_00385 [Pseudomonadota bacterium]